MTPARTHHDCTSELGAWIAALLVIACALAPAVAWAERSGAGDDAARARELYRAAELRYREGMFEEAVDLLREAISLHDAAPLHYNLGRSYQELGRWDEARDAYRAFLDREPDSPQRAQVEERMAEIDRLAAEAQVRAPPPEDPPEIVFDDAPPPRADAPSRRVSASPWVIFGTGVLGLGVGVALSALFLGQMDIAENPATPPDQAASALDLAERYSLAGTICLVVGGALAVAGLVWGIIDLVRRRDARQARGAPPWARLLGLAPTVL